MKPGIHFEQVTAIDVPVLHELARATFFESFSEVNTPKNMNAYLDKAFSIERLEDEVNNPDSKWFFGRAGGNIAGYFKVNFGRAQNESLLENSMELERIYVLQKYQGLHVGQQLMQKCIEIAKSSGVDCVWLGVWEKNERAINFYLKNGFVQFNKHEFMLGDDLQIDFLMKLDLSDPAT